MIEVYYQPIEVATIWGQLQKASSKFGKKFGIGIGVFILFCLFLVCLRRKKRKGYSSLEESDWIYWCINWLLFPSEINDKYWYNVIKIKR